MSTLLRSFSLIPSDRMGICMSQRLPYPHEGAAEALLRGRHRAADDVGDLGCREPLPSPEAENLCVLVRQRLDGTKERLVFGIAHDLELGTRRRVDGLGPYPAPQPVRSHRETRIVPRHVPSDSEQPRLDTGRSVISFPPSHEEHLRDGIVGIGDGETPQAVAANLGEVLVEQTTELHIGGLGLSHHLPRSADFEHICPARSVTGHGVAEPGSRMGTEGGEHDSPFNFVGPTAPDVNQQLAHARPRPVSALQEHRRILPDSGLTGRPLPDA